LKDQIDNVLADRQTTHGNYADTARTAQHLRGAMREGNNWSILTDTQRESLDMIAMKIARILSGDPQHADHWDDITGYARLVSTSLHDVTPKPAIMSPDPREELERLASIRPRAVE
jgi:hypothetical protein